MNPTLKHLAKTDNGNLWGKIVNVPDRRSSVGTWTSNYPDGGCRLIVYAENLKNQIPKELSSLTMVDGASFGSSEKVTFGKRANQTR